jgi:diketogulonate reductase-like aldo/keto reductase
MHGPASPMLRGPARDFSLAACPGIDILAPRAIEPLDMTAFVTIDGIDVPAFFYGTAWKEDRTAQLTEQALRAGFRAIDTANQRKHYHEEGVGQGLQAFLQSGRVTRDELFLQTKFTYARGQDHRKPYDPKASYTAQVEQSFASSLQHLGVDRIDSYVLHGPYSQTGLAQADFEVWQAMEALHGSGKVRMLGVSNFQLEQLEELHDRATVKPRFIQNRCYAALDWDRDIRAFCSAKGIRYQGFSLLTANRRELRSPMFDQMAEKYRRTVPQIVFRFAAQVGMIPLTGTSSEEHMRTDLDALDIEGFELTEAEVEQIEHVALR